MITPDEIRRAAAIVRADARFEAGRGVRAPAPARAATRTSCSASNPARRSTARSRRCSSRPGAARGDRGGRVGDHAARSVRGRRTRACARRCCSASRCRRSSASRATPTGRPRCAGAGIEDFDLVQIDPWPAGSFGSPHEDGRRISRCISYLRESKTDNGYARPIEGVHRVLRQRRRRGARGRRPRRRADAARARHVPPRRRRAACAPTSSRSRSSSPRVRASHVDGNLVQLAAVVVPRRLRPVRGAGAAHGRLPRRRPRAAGAAPRVDHARWSCPTATPARCTAGRTRSTPASGASAAWPTR